MIEFFQNAPWHHLSDFFANGNPPLILRILILNTVFFVVFAFRRARGIPAMRAKTAVWVQSLLITANALVLFEPEIRSGLGFIDRLI